MPSRDPVATSTRPGGETGENAIAVTELPCPARMATGTPWFGPNLIRTMTSARSAPVMPDIMDHVAMPTAAGGSPVTGLADRCGPCS